MEIDVDDDRNSLPGQAPLTSADREFLLGRALLVILALNIVWAIVIVAIVIATT